jgi:hypothetical protein
MLFPFPAVRTFYWRLQEILKKGKHSQPPVSLVGQLLWREFFYTCGATIENFDKMEGTISLFFERPVFFNKSSAPLVRGLS